MASMVMRGGGRKSFRQRRGKEASAMVSCIRSGIREGCGERKRKGGILKGRDSLGRGHVTALETLIVSRSDRPWYQRSATLRRYESLQKYGIGLESDDQEYRRQAGGEDRLEGLMMRDLLNL